VDIYPPKGLAGEKQPVEKFEIGINELFLLAFLFHRLHFLEYCGDFFELFTSFRVPEAQSC